MLWEIDDKQLKKQHRTKLKEIKNRKTKKVNYYGKGSNLNSKY